MDKFLLLRDNKQTGPYSAAELEKMGLKAYDLIWEEGRSAAWRYPGEISALKSFAPPVEEQPYDRFYKKEQPENSSNHTDIQSKPEKKSNSVSTSHIFVSVPNKKPASIPEKKELRESSPAQFQHVAYQPGDSEQALQPIQPTLTQPQKRLTHQSYEKPASSEQTKEKGIRPVHWMSAALVLFALISIFLFINYRQQHQQLSRLNEIVLNMQQGQPLNTTPVHNAVSPVIQQESNIIDTLGYTPLQYEKPAERTTDPSVKKHTSKNIINKTDSIPVQKVEPAEEQIKMITENAQPVRSARKRNMADQFSVTTNEDFKVGFLGGISNLQVTVGNQSDKPVDKVEVLVEYLSKENKVVKSQALTFNKVEAGAQLTKEVPRTARGVSVRCRISSIEQADSVANNEDPRGKTP